MKVNSVLYVRLPCWKIYPGGVVQVADFVHKRHPEIRQHILDLAVVPPARRRQAIKDAMASINPDVVGFSWRNMQSFGPHPEDDALDIVMDFDHSPNPLQRAVAAFKALGIIWDYAANRLRNFGYMKLVRRTLPKSRIVVGGTAVTIFGKYVIEKCPPDSIVCIGEGEDLMVSVVEGFERPAGDYYYKDAAGKVTHNKRAAVLDIANESSAIDFPYVESIFPSFSQYIDHDLGIGVNTKRGCPYRCNFCLYNRIEGPDQRYRDPAEIGKEIEMLNRRYGVKRIWFTDAQFCSTLPSTLHVEKILDEMLARGTDVRWSGYLRLNYITPEIARKMLASGMSSVDISFTGSQELIDKMTLGYSLDQQMAALRMFRENGYTDQKIKLYIPLNAPGETRETLRMTIEKIRGLYDMFGRDNVLPFIFFLGIQPGTPVESELIEGGYLKAGYNPLTLNPFIIKRLLYNPQPLGRTIARAYLEAAQALDVAGDYVGRLTLDILERELARADT